MKIAISIPDALHEEAEELARRLGVTRSGLYQKALESLVKRYSEKELIRRINEVCADVDTSLAPDLAEAAATGLAQLEWEV